MCLSKWTERLNSDKGRVWSSLSTDRLCNLTGVSVPVALRANGVEYVFTSSLAAPTSSCG